MNPQQTNNPSPIVQGGFSEMPQPDTSQDVGGHKKASFIVIVVVVAVVLIGAIIYMATQLSTNPGKLWSTALTNTNTASTAVINFMGQPSSNGYDISGTFNTKNSASASATFSGTTTGSLNGLASTFTSKIPVQGNNILIDTVANPVDGAPSPDIYYRISGLSGLSQIFEQNNGSSSFTDNAGQVEGKWLLLPHTDPASAQTALQLNQNVPLPQSSIADVSSKINALNAQYLYGTDASKAVLTDRQNVGEETVNKRNVYHYKFTFRPAHFKAYVAAVRAVLGSSSQDVTTLEQRLGIENLNTVLSTVNGTPTADVLVDKASQTISVLHIPVATGSNNFVETGFNGVSGSVYPYYVSLHADANNVTTVKNYSLSVNTKGNGFTYAYGQSNTSTTGTVTSTATTVLQARTSPLTVSIPTNASDFEANSSALNAVFSGLFPN